MIYFPDLENKNKPYDIAEGRKKQQSSRKKV